ncbi:Pycsar system effector family protein [Burkholderia gladioli]|nr:Pycsar system effector family protein [Burkholderia gladioli]ASD83717.1 hypothetical protein CEJ98_33295 [Burkholderia gladioli pv. gladioli]
MMAGTRTHEEQQKLLLEIIKRFDGYINATNSKIAVVLSCCTAYIGGLGFKPVDLSDKREHDWAWWGLLAVSLLSVLSTLVAGQYAYPAARSSCKRQPPARHTRNPLLFFCDVASHAGGRDGYTTYLVSMTAEDVNTDLSAQAQVLATIAASKFRLLGRGIN